VAFRYPSACSGEFHLVLAPEEQNIYRKKEMGNDSRPWNIVEQGFGPHSDGIA